MAQLTDIPGLDRRIRITQARLGLLRAAGAFWPLGLLATVFLAAALLGLFDRMPAGAAAIATLVFLVGGAALALIGRRRFAPPTRAEAVDRLDRQSDARPLFSLPDRPADPSPAAQGLWRAHLDRLADAAAALRPPSMAAAWRGVDPYNVRYAAPALLVGAAIVAGADGPGRLARALSPDYGALMGAEDLRIDAWLTPPDYSGKAPAFLTADTDELEAPSGSEVTIRVQARSAPRLVLDTPSGRSRVKFEATPDGAFETKTVITGDTDLSVNWWGARAGWRILATPDAPPAVVFTEPPALGENDATAFGWSAGDDYGLERLSLVLSLAEPNPAAPDETHEQTLELPGLRPKSAEAEVAIDLTRHRWAGLEVKAWLRVEDGAGQIGESKAQTFRLPEKLFLQPLAKAAQEVRVTILREPRSYDDAPPNPLAVASPSAAGDRLNTAPFSRLDLAPPDVRLAALMLDAITYEAPRFFNDYGLFLGLRTSRGVLAAASDKAEADSVEPILWAVALKAEYGSSADALARLLAAKQALERALRDGASEEEIRRLTDAFRQAAENYVQARLAEALINGLPEGRQPGQDDALGGAGGGFGGQDLDDMLTALEELSETGATDQARQLLSDITNLLENLEFQQGGQGGEGGFALPGGGEGEEADDAPAAEQELSETLEELSELLREQRELNDDTLESSRRGPGAEPLPGLDGESLARRQEQLRDLLEGLAQGERPGAGDPSREGEEGAGAGEEGEERAGLGGGRWLDEDDLERILRSQDEAAGALRNGQNRRAEANQQRATSELRDLAGQLAEALDQLRSERLGEDGSGGDERDPFGRPLGGGAGNVEVPDEAERRRAQDILNELRRRLEDAENADERDYLERLLDRF